MVKKTVHHAFPHEDGQFEGENDVGSHGMTLRDYFAAKAMQSLIQKYDGQTGCMDDVPIDAYLYADAMLEQREK